MNENYGIPSRAFIDKYEADRLARRAAALAEHDADAQRDARHEAANIEQRLYAQGVNFVKVDVRDGGIIFVTPHRPEGHGEVYVITPAPWGKHDPSVTRVEPTKVAPSYTLTVEGEAEEPIDLDTFIADNAEGLDGPEEFEALRTLAVGEERRFGGGAASMFTVRRQS